MGCDRKGVTCGFCPVFYAGFLWLKIMPVLRKTSITKAGYHRQMHTIYESKTKKYKQEKQK